MQWAQLLPVRCDWQRDDGVITYCADTSNNITHQFCRHWKETLPTSPEDATTEHFARQLGVRTLGIVEIVMSQTSPADFTNDTATADFYVRAIVNETHTVALTYVLISRMGDQDQIYCSSHLTVSVSLFRRNVSLFLLLLSMVLLGLFGLTVMRTDAERLVLHPLQRMLLIVVRCKHRFAFK